MSSSMDAGRAHGRDAAPRTVVLIEDDEVIARLTQYMLAREGYDVVVAHDAASGLEAVREHRPTVVLLDLTLPGSTGDEVCRAVRSDPLVRDTFLVVMTARDEREARQRARDAGADAYACKPCDPDRMLEIVAEGFAAASATAATARRSGLHS